MKARTGLNVPARREISAEARALRPEALRDVSQGVVRIVGGSGCGAGFQPRMTSVHDRARLLFGEDLR